MPKLTDCSCEIQTDLRSCWLTVGDEVASRIPHLLASNSSLNRQARQTAAQAAKAFSGLSPLSRDDTPVGNVEEYLKSKYNLKWKTDYEVFDTRALFSAMHPELDAAIADCVRRQEAFSVLIKNATNPAASGHYLLGVGCDGDSIVTIDPLTGNEITIDYTKANSFPYSNTGSDSLASLFQIIVPLK